MSPHPRHRDRGGMTLPELMIALVITLIVVTTALSFFQQQVQAMQIGTGAMRVAQNHRFAISTLRRELRTAGSNVPAKQPPLVYAGADAVVFNADFAAAADSDVFAVYVDSSLPNSAVGALTPAQKGEVAPGTGMMYPDSAYFLGTTNSPAETIAFYFVADATTPRTDDFVLMRRVNREPASVVARNLLRTNNLPFFEYLRLVEEPGELPVVSPFSASTLPLKHAAIHGNVGDSLKVSPIDAIRGVRVQLTATNGRTGAKETRRSTRETIRLTNIGVTALEACGRAPQLNITLSATAQNVGGERRVRLAWTAAADESGGERDILRYLVWRIVNDPTSTNWGEPYLSISAGQTSYVYVDENLTPNTQYRYAVAGQDCTPLQSALATATANTN